MDEIPPEILSSILSDVAVTKLAQYASVSRKWQVAVERITFSSLQLSASDLDAFREAFDCEKSKRRCYLRSLKVRCILPDNEAETACCVVTEHVDRQIDSVEFSSFIGRLFSILDNITRRCLIQTRGPPAMSLTFLETFRGNRTVYRPLEGVCTKCKTAEHETRKIEAARAQPGKIELHGAQLLPSLTHVSHLSVCGWGESKNLRPNWIGNVSEKIPGLQHIQLYLEDPYDWGCNWRGQYQADLANSFTKLPTMTLETLHVHVFTQEILNEDVPVHRLSTPGLGDHVYDRLLQRLSAFHQLRALFLTGPLTVSPTLFESCASGALNIPFPLLEEFALEFTPTTSDGRWFYLRDEAAFKAHSDNDSDVDSEQDEEGFVVYGDTPVREREVSDRNKYRSLPNPETFTPFLTSAARLCAIMPRIKRFSMKLNKNSMNQERLHYEFVDRVFELWFLSAGQKLEKFNKTVGNPVIPLDIEIAHYDRVYFRVGECKIEQEIVESWRAVVGVDGKMNFLDEKHCEYYQPWGWLRMQYTGKVLQET